MLDPAHIVAERAVEGGPQPAELEKLFAAIEEELRVRAAETQILVEHLSAAEARLEKDFAELLGK